MQAPKAAELIASHLRRQIVRGELPIGGTLPPEAQLIEEFNVSRPTLREAFRILESETLIHVRRGSRGGAQVTRPQLSVAAKYFGLLLQLQGTTIGDVYDARTAMEPECVRLLAVRRTKADLVDLGNAIKELRAVVDAGAEAVPNPALWSRLTYGFHELIVERCGNQTLTLQSAIMQDIVRTHMDQSVAAGFGERQNPIRFQRALAAFSKLAELIEAKDKDAAARHWSLHMKAVRKYLVGTKQETPVVDLFT